MEDDARYQVINDALWQALQKECPEQCTRVLDQPRAQIDSTYLGFVNTYEALARLIPLDWTVVDVGCSYAAQAYYFRKHKAYIGVERRTRPLTKTFCFQNSEFVWMKGEEFVKSQRHMGQLNLDKTFAICNYVPCGPAKPVGEDDVQTAVRKAFKNVYCFYPA